jgi:hypothetical protein
LARPRKDIETERIVLYLPKVLFDEALVRYRDPLRPGKARYGALAQLVTQLLSQHFQSNPLPSLESNNVTD